MSSALLSQEREAWSRERSRLEKALQQAQAQTGRLRGEVRSEALSDVTGPDLDNAALKVSGGEGGNGDACLTRSNMSAYDHAGCQTDALQPDLYTREWMKFRIVFCICM